MGTGDDRDGAPGDDAPRDGGDIAGGPTGETVGGPTGETVDGTVDGRTLRGKRTRAAIVDALLSLLQGGEARPTAKRIAEVAGVSVRSIFQHFDDLEGLYTDLVRVQAERVRPLVESLTGDGDLQERIDALVAQRAELFESVTPIRRSLGSARRSPVIVERLQSVADVNYAQVRSQFAAELHGPDNDAVAMAVDSLCSFETWDHLREHRALDIAGARRVLAVSLRTLLRAEPDAGQI